VADGNPRNSPEFNGFRLPVRAKPWRRRQSRRRRLETSKTLAVGRADAESPAAAGSGQRLHGKNVGLCAKSDKDGGFTSKQLVTAGFHAQTEILSAKTDDTP
jgi:hypothetical protein